MVLQLVLELFNDENFNYLNVTQYGYIYILKNKINSKLYIGQTTKILKQRLSQHFHSNNQIIDKAIKKYNISNFKIFKFKIPISLLDYYEQKLIKDLDTLVPLGYNLDLGGNKQKIRGKITLEKISQNRKGKCQGKNSPVAKLIICLNTLEIFDTITEASIHYNINRNHISSCCKYKRNSSGKDQNNNFLVWTYYEDYLKMSELDIKNKIERPKNNNKKENNPFYNKHLSTEIKEKISFSRKKKCTGETN